jgi:omega-6 fatty acid desaturase (delta-12 desaturase)
MGLFLLDVSGYAALVLGAVAMPAIWQRVLCGTLAGLATALLFIVGHDACHGSFTRYKWFNEVLGRIAFLPSLHAFSLWNLGHNQIHHRFTNLKETDYVWRPFSKEEFDGLSPVRRRLERLYRSTLGLGLYYGVEIWWKKMVFPNRHEVVDRKRLYVFDSCLVAAFAALQIGVVMWLGFKVGSPWYASLGFGVALPFAVWNWLMGFVIFQHHTHPSVAWFEDSEEWTFWESQIEETTHVRFPWLAGLLLHNIMEHTAHHAFTGIPLYQLPKAQSALEASFQGRVKVVPWTMSGFLDAVGRCKLYDYQRHYWTDFEGNETSNRTVNLPVLDSLVGRIATKWDRAGGY